MFLAPLLLALAAPAPKADKGLPKELIDLIPEDTAAVLVLNVPKAAASDLGKTALKLALKDQTPDDPIQVDTFVRDAELVVVAQFLIDKAFGDFCILVRLKDKSDLPKTLIGRADKAGKDKAPEQIGKRTVYTIGDPGASFAVIDDRTLMFVLAIGDENQVKETRAAAYTERDKPGPSQVLRRMLTDGDADDRPLRVYGSHPTKLALSAQIVLAPFGVKDKAIAGLGDKLVSYRGGIKESKDGAGEVELRLTAKNADAAAELLKGYDQVENGGERFVRDFRATAKAVRDGDEVVITAKLTPALVERLGESPNK